MKTKEEFIEKAIKVHGDKYDYSKVEFVDDNTKVTIICPIHGEFEQSPKSHAVRGYGCRKCGRLVCADKRKKTNEQIIREFKEVHGDKYDYSKVNYVNAFTDVTIICPKHGEFEQPPHDHLKGCGCKECANEKIHILLSDTQEEFIEKARKVHGNKYDYSKVNYLNQNTNVTVICPEHGEFNQTPNNHLSGSGCRLCGIENTKNNRRMGTNYFISRAKNVHGNKYDYSNTDLNRRDENGKITIRCEKHGYFNTNPSWHLAGVGCPSCGGQMSKAENDIYSFLVSYFGSEGVQQRNKLLIHPYELDIYVRPLKYAIEYNGLRWHSEKFGKNNNYHVNKLEECKKRGIKLIQIFEDEYINHKELVYEKLKHIFSLETNSLKIGARKCIVNEIDKKTAEMFLTKYHIQGFVGSTVYLGCYYNNELIAVMSFKREAKNTNKWELTRFASNYNYICQGVGGKLFNYFVRKYQPEEVKSFADRRWTVNETDNIYTKLSFEFDSYTPPEYRYFKESDGLIRQHKFGFRKDKLHKQYGLPLSMTEEQMTQYLGYTKIYDCGLIKYVWKK